jgi:hypothetical protein
LENKEFLTDIIFSSDEIANHAYKELLLHTISINFEYRRKELRREIANYEAIYIEKSLSSKDSIPVIQLLDLLVSWLPNEVSKNWMKMTAYLEVNYIINSATRRH